MLKESGKDVYLGGNIGVAPLTFLDKLSSDSWVVLELSSFQLLDLHKSPHIAVMLMITSEHMDYHQSNEEYIDAKRNLVRFQTAEDFAIINRDYPASHESDIYTDAQIYLVSRERETDNASFVVGDKVIVRKNGSDDVILTTGEILLPGKHNLENVSAAVMAAKLAEVGDKYIVTVLKRFKGLAHRLELVREIDGAAYYDDSFSTTPETAIAAIEAFPNPKILILGGSSKGSDFTQLGKVLRVSESIKAIIGIGDEWETIKAELDTTNVKKPILLIEGAQSMQTAVKAAAKLARSGDVVLLSPACASFGMFKNYKDRGDQFQKEVKELGK
jgi:UDP-N-acetylmuramoylalanine--D-glutamate ligase